MENEIRVMTFQQELRIAIVDRELCDRALDLLESFREKHRLNIIFALYCAAQKGVVREALLLLKTNHEVLSRTVDANDGEINELFRQLRGLVRLPPRKTTPPRHAA